MARISTKRYGLSKMKDGKYDWKSCQFPAMDKSDSLKQGARHAASLGWDEYRIEYIGKWIKERDPETYEVAPE